MLIITSTVFPTFQASPRILSASKQTYMAFDLEESQPVPILPTTPRLLLNSNRTSQDPLVSYSSRTSLLGNNSKRRRGSWNGEPGWLWIGSSVFISSPSHRPGLIRILEPERQLGSRIVGGWASGKDKVQGSVSMLEALARRHVTYVAEVFWRKSGLDGLSLDVASGWCDALLKLELNVCVAGGDGGEDAGLGVD